MAFSTLSRRPLFPAVLNDDQTYLDNASGSQDLGSAIDAITDYLSTGNVQVGTSHEVGHRSTALKEAYQAAARHMGAEVDEIVYGASATQLLRNLSYSLRFEPGDEIIISSIDHESNISPWLDLAERQNLVVRWWRPQPSEKGDNPKLGTGNLNRLLSSKTRLVACTHVSNVLGTINNIAEICRTAHTFGALVCVDGVAYAPHRPLNVKLWGVDFHVFSWAKSYGPHIATLYASWKAQMQMKSLGHFFNPSASLEQKLGLSAQSYELCHAVPRVAEYLGSPEAWEAIKYHEMVLETHLVHFLRGRPGVTIYGDMDSRPDGVSTVSFKVHGWDSRILVESIERQSNIRLQWGAFGSDRLVRETLGLGPSGVVRVSMLHYNTANEISSLIQTLRDVLDGSQQGSCNVVGTPNKA